MGSQAPGGLEIPEPCKKHIQTLQIRRGQWFFLQTKKSIRTQDGSLTSQNWAEKHLVLPLEMSS